LAWPEPVVLVVQGDARYFGLPNSDRKRTRSRNSARVNESARPPAITEPFCFSLYRVSPEVNALVSQRVAQDQPDSRLTDLVLSIRVA